MMKENTKYETNRKVKIKNKKEMKVRMLVSKMKF